MLATNSLSIRYDPSTGTAPCSTPTLRHMQVDLVAIVVEDYDPAITFFVDVLGFELVEDSPSLTNDGRPKRWVVVRPSRRPKDGLLSSVGSRLRLPRRGVPRGDAPYSRLLFPR